MTQKELLYIEDAISHEDNIIKYLKEEKTILKDTNIIKFFDNEINVHNKTKKRLLNILKENSNE